MAHWLSLSSSQTVSAEHDDSDCCFSWLLRDLVIMIVERLDLKAAVALFRTSTFFWRLSTRKDLWQRIYHNTFGTCFVRTEFVKMYHNDLVVPSHSEWTLGETSRTVTIPFAPFPHIPWRWMCIAWSIKAGKPRVRDIDEERQNEDTEDTDAVESDDLSSSLDKSYLNIKNGLAHLACGDINQSFIGLWDNSDIVMGIYGTLVDGVESYVYGGTLYCRRGHGLGVTVFPTGGHYIGDFANGELDGEGALYYKEGDEYVGGWSRNVKSGFGVYKWISGNIYTGQWTENRREGKIGELRWSNGDTYVGEWIDNRRTGVGVLRWSASRGGGCYEGEFLDNQLHGWGRFTFRGIRYDGHWEADRREGKGTLTWDGDGDWFEGSWIQGGRQGPGILHLADGSQIEQMWDEPADIKYSQVTPLKFVPNSLNSSTSSTTNTCISADSLPPTKK